MQDFEQKLQDKARALVSVLDQGNLIEAMDLIRDLHEFRHQAFYNEVGHLTRGLHEAIKSFTADVNTIETEDEHHVIDASERLNYVIELSEKTSHEIMDRVDSALTLVDRLDDQSSRFKDLLTLVAQLEDENPGLKGMYDRTCQLKEESEQTVGELRSQLTDVVVSQSYQDLSGQLIRRVITLIGNVESHLVQLMEMAAKIEHLVGISPPDEEVVLNQDAKSQSSTKVNHSATDPLTAQGPQLRGKEQENAACDQDEVDELLSSLGF